jgi:hypothetical protein
MTLTQAQLEQRRKAAQWQKKPEARKQASQRLKAVWAVAKAAQTKVKGKSK